MRSSMAARPVRRLSVCVGVAVVALAIGTGQNGSAQQGGRGEGARGQGGEQYSAHDR